MGLFTLGAVFGRLIGGWLMDDMEGRYSFMLGFCCYFLGSIPAVRVSPQKLEPHGWTPRNNSRNPSLTLKALPNTSSPISQSSRTTRPEAWIRQIPIAT